MIESQDPTQNPGKIRSKEEEDTEEPPDQQQLLTNKVQQKPISGNTDTQNTSQINFDADQLDNGDMFNMAQSGQFQYRKIDIILYDQYKGSKTVFQNKKCFINQEKEIMLSMLIEQIKNDYKNDFKGALISYFDSIQDMFVFCGQYPLDKTSVVPLDTIVGDSLEIKIRTKKKNLVDLLTEEQKNREQKDKNDEYDIPQNSQQKQRVKERRIGEVVEKVALWRRFYTGFFDENQQFKSMPLEKAANEVGISKKTLDDYLLQIRCGKKYGFDFNKNKDQRIGKLRSYVKDHKTGKTDKKK